MSAPLATLGIVSIGDMGAGIARLLIANGYRVITNAADRRLDILLNSSSQATQTRAQKLSIDLIPNDIELYDEADYILSIVPPRDAFATARRIVSASTTSTRKDRKRPLYFLDLNAVSPASARQTHDLFQSEAPSIRFIDGGILGGPPKLQADGTWYRPSIPLSGPHELVNSEASGRHLTEVLNVRQVDAKIGSASGLKMCFASINKGLTGLAIQSYTTASNLGVLDELQSYMEHYNPPLAKQVARTLVTMPPKAYRWVHEMQEIAATFEVDGGFSEDESSFRSMAQIYKLIADGTELGSEKTEDRKRGQTAEEVARLTGEGTRNRTL